MLRLKIDWGLIIVQLAFCGLSIALIWSTNPSYLIPQLIFFLIGFGLFIFLSQLNSEILYHLGKPFYVVSLIILAATLLSIEIRGASRWVEIFGYRMQPSEIVKPLLIVSFAYFFSSDTSANILNYLKKGAFFMLPMIIIFFQPDLGNVIIYFFFFTAMFIANRLDLKIIFGVFILGVIGSPVFWRLLRDYQKKRILTFISPELDPQGAGYNSIQAMIAVGSGRLFGQGLGRGTQSHLRFLPENHTDFIFASLVEELGLFGAFMLLTLFGYLFFRILRLAQKCDNKFSYLLTIGIFTQLISQVFINIAMNMGLLPITGVTLPLVSSGGSSLLATFIALGIIVSLEQSQKQQPLVIR